MIDWIIKSALLTSVVMLFIMITRQGFRERFGAHISYALWLMIPLTMLIYSLKDHPMVQIDWITNESANMPLSLPVYTSPTFLNSTAYDWVFWTWIVGLGLFVSSRTVNLIVFRSQLAKTRIPIQLSRSVTNLIEIPDGLPPIFCASVTTPLVTGLFNPRIYLPDDFESRYTTSQQAMIIKHEWMHVQRRDLFSQLLADFTRAVYWFNPLVHLVWSAFIEDQEMACDRSVIKDSNKQETVDYASALRTTAVARLNPHSLNFFNHKITRYHMLKKHKTNPYQSFKGSLLILLSMLLIFFSTQIVFASDDPTDRGPKISYEFNDIPAKDIVQLVSLSSEGDEVFHNLAVLEGVIINAKADEVYAFDFLESVLQKHGIKFTRNDLEWTFSK